MNIKTINFTPTPTSCIYQQLYQKIADDIAEGFLKKDDRLPSVRKLADALSISRTTVEAAYAKLCDNGYLVSYPKRGFFILMNAKEARKREEILEVKPIKNKIEINYDFSSDSIDSLCFDTNLWKRYIKESLADDSKIYSYGDIQGEPQLRQALQRYAYTMRGVLCKENQIVIGASFQSLLYQLCGLMHKPQIIAMEACGFSKAEQVFHDYGFQVLKIPMQEEGLSIKELRRYPITAIYLHSAAVGKSKLVMSQKQRKELMAFAEEKEVLIIEDDHNGELRYQSKPMPAMQGMDVHNRVVYIGSFSKLLLPSLRIGYMVLNETYQRRYHKNLQNYSPTSSKIEQLAFAHYICDGHLEKQIKRSKKRYEYKSTMMIKYCTAIFKNWEVHLEEAALRVRLHAPIPYPTDRLLQAALAQHIRLQKNEDDDLVLSFTSIQVECLEEVLTTIYNLFKELI